MRYIYSIAGPVIVLLDVQEISTQKFNSPEALEHELKYPDTPPSLGGVLFVRTTDGRFFSIDLDDVLNKQLAGIFDYSSCQDLVRSKIIESWLEITGRKP